MKWILEEIREKSKLFVFAVHHHHHVMTVETTTKVEIVIAPQIELEVVQEKHLQEIKIGVDHDRDHDQSRIYFRNWQKFDFDNINL